MGARAHGHGRNARGLQGLAFTYLSVVGSVGHFEGVEGWWGGVGRGCSWSGEFFERWCRWDREDCGWIYSNAPRRARAWAPQLPPQEAGAFAVCWRLIGCTSLASHANAAGIHIQTCGCGLDTPNNSLPDTKVTESRDTASHAAI